jgi:GxxExxY protein
VGEYVADLIVEDTVLVEIKAAENLDKAHMAQCLNYLKATGLGLCLLINFGRPRVQIQRVINDV